MFQGIVIGLGTVKKIEDKEDFRTIGIDLNGLIKTEEGGSVSVNGTCLTTTRSENGVNYFDVMKESLDKTNIGILKEGDKVNLEKPIKLGDEISGHLVQGHVEAVSLITNKIVEGDNTKVFFSLPGDFMDEIIPKGSIAIDGISLTVVDVDKDKKEFSVALIPETLKRTTLGFKKEQDTVNIETDFLVRSLLNQFNMELFLEAMGEIGEKMEKMESRISKLEGGNG